MYRNKLHQLQIFSVQNVKGGYAHFNKFNWLTLTSEMHFVKIHPLVASYLLSRGKRKYAPLGMRLLWKYIRNYFLVYQLTSHFSSYLQNYKEFEAEILDLQLEQYGLPLDIKKCTTSGWALGDEDVIGIRSFKPFENHSVILTHKNNMLSKYLLCGSHNYAIYSQLIHYLHGSVVIMLL